MSRYLVTALAAAIVAAQSAGARLAVSGGEIAYDDAGTGPPVVLLHGAFMERRAWDPQLPALTPRFRVIRYDIRPFGQSTRPETPYRMTDDLLQVLDRLRIDRAHLMGHSMGGQLAIDFALAHPARVASLVLAGAAPSGTVPTAEEVKAIASIFAAAKSGEDAVLSAWLAHPMWSASQKRSDVMKALESSTRPNLRVFSMTSPPFVPTDPPAIKRLRDITAPTLIVVGDRDLPSLRQAADLLAREIPGAVLKVVAGADHALPIGWAKDFNAVALEFLLQQPKR
jgi:pimeloyl-ACP methyl ester carboxylesterase